MSKESLKRYLVVLKYSQNMNISHVQILIFYELELDHIPANAATNFNKIFGTVRTAQQRFRKFRFSDTYLVK